LAALVLFGWLACSKGKTTVTASTAPQPESRNTSEIVLNEAEQVTSQINTQIVKLEREPDLLRVPGRITLSDNGTWRVGVITEGRVEQVFAGLGDYVHQGQVLARMHSHDVHESRAMYFTAVSDLSRLKAAAQLAQRNYDRMQRLYALKAASLEQTEMAKQELTDAQTALRNGEIAVERDRQHLEENLGIPADVSPKQSRQKVDLIPITAPANGYILAKNVTPGTVVQPSTDVFVISELSHLWMIASVRQELIGNLRVGQSATVTVAAYPQDSFQGAVTNVGQQIDPVTRLLNARIELSNPDGRLRPEMLANAEIAVGEPKPVLLIPNDAVQQVNEQNVVFVKTAADRFQVRAIEAGEPINGRVRVTQGLSGGEHIVTHGSFILKSQLLKSMLQGE
jgi:RND family efflux transporter MFP subunit